jgi:hypothetical protein
MLPEVNGGKYNKSSMSTRVTWPPVAWDCRTTHRKKKKENDPFGSQEEDEE